ncbi:MAG: hypothetical protein ACOYI5_02390 [Christensenellales bacterium]|jgi:hypothetical protein
MYELVKCYAEDAPATRFIGKKYGDADRDEGGGFGKQWEDFHQNGWDALLEQAAAGAETLFPDGLSHVGLMRWAVEDAGEPFEYWVGIFAPPDAPVPEGFEFVDFAPAKLGVVWIRGAQGEIYGNEAACADYLEKNGMKVASVDGKGRAWYFFERYVCERFMPEGAEDQSILDICHYIE